PAKKVGILSFGTNDPAIQEARDMLKAQHIETNYMRVRALPLDSSVTDFINSHDRIYIPENNFDGQLYQVICLDHPQDLTHLKSLPLGDGLPMTAQWLFDKIMAVEK
ncbi:MAG: 2-oxoacid:acceptor oxidoreductase subunit alpha, partial [Anaerolineae bacterium]|nr:2-oxoacid:acceptor oxidoreductase subunit alpha [Anaerolineae bacterium]